MHAIIYQVPGQKEGNTTFFVYNRYDKPRKGELVGHKYMLNAAIGLFMSALFSAANRFGSKFLL